jgi:hypothetical protein
MVEQVAFEIGAERTRGVGIAEYEFILNNNIKLNGEITKIAYT